VGWGGGGVKVPSLLLLTLVHSIWGGCDGSLVRSVKAEEPDRTGSHASCTERILPQKPKEGY